MATLHTSDLYRHDYPDGLLAALGALAEAGDRDIYVESGGGALITPPEWGDGGDDEPIRVYLWGAFTGPFEFRSHSMPTGAFREDSAPEDASLPTYSDWVTLDDESVYDQFSIDGVPFAEIAPGAVVYHPYMQYLRAREYNWELLTSPVRLCTNPELVARSAERREQRNRDMFLAAVQRRDTGQLGRLRSEVRLLEREIVTHQRSITEHRTRLDDLRDQVDVMLARRQQEFNPESVLPEWDALRRHTKVRRLSWSDERRLVVFTNDIEMTRPDTGESTIVGQFALTFDFDNNTIRVVNLTNARGGRAHPHVENAGFCAGEVQPTIDQLVRRGEVGAAVNLVIRSLEHVNPQDAWGRHVEWWFTEADQYPPETTDERDAMRDDRHDQ